MFYSKAGYSQMFAKVCRARSIHEDFFGFQPPAKQHSRDITIGAEMKKGGREGVLFCIREGGKREKDFCKGLLFLMYTQ